MEEKMKKKKIVVGILIATMTLMAVLTGCGSKEEPEKTAKESDVKGTIVAVGSSALQPLAQQVAKDFQKQYPEATVTVQGGGSGMGLSQIASGAVQIGNSDIFAQDKGIDAKDLLDNKVAVVGMGPVVNKDVKVSNITQEQLIKIFTGEVKNWKDVGGQDLPIVVINRAEGSGTRATFEKFGLNGNSSMKAQEQDNSGSVLKIVKETPGAISYLAFSYYTDDVKPLSIDGVKPEQKNVENNSWKIWSYEHMYTNKDMDPVTKAYIEFIQSKDVQEKLIPKLGYIPMTGMKVERDADGQITEK